MSVLNENVAALVQQFNQKYLILHRIQQCFFLVYPKKKKKKKPAKRMKMKLKLLLFHEIYDAKNVI